MDNISIDSMVNNSSIRDNPISKINNFLENENIYEQSENFKDMRFVGYVLELGYENATIITADVYKENVGGIPRGSFLILIPNNYDKLPVHFSLLRVSGVSPTPLSENVKQTYFELHKKAMPDLDIWTKNELQWGALSCEVLGMFYPDPNSNEQLAFSGDVNNVVSAHKYKVFSPNDEILDLIVNGIVKKENQFEIGYLRTMECQLMVENRIKKSIPVLVSLKDFKGARTAMFGKTRLGKSNVVKLLAEGVLKNTIYDKSVGQLIFDINGEYANDSTQDGGASLRSLYDEQCRVYAINKRSKTPSKPLKLNFYEYPSVCIQVLSSMLEKDNKLSNYVRGFMSVELKSLDELKKIDFNDRATELRKIQIYWAILKKSGFKVDENSIKKAGFTAGKYVKNFDPHFDKDLRTKVYKKYEKIEYMKENINNLDELLFELELIGKFINENPEDICLYKKKKKENDNDNDKKRYFDPDIEVLFKFLVPKSKSSTGVSILRNYNIYHDSNAGDFVNEILKLLDNAYTVILDLGNANKKIIEYFSDLLSNEIFNHQEKKFTSDNLGKHYIQLYFEEAHNIFPLDNKDMKSVYSRFAKEGAKFQIGMIYSTQSPSTINKELLVQTENFFVGHLSSQDEVRALVKLQVAYQGIEVDILRSKTPGFMRMLTLSNRFIIPVQANKFNDTSKES